MIYFFSDAKIINIYGFTDLQMYKFIFLFDLFQYLLLLRFEPSSFAKSLVKKNKNHQNPL